MHKHQQRLEGAGSPKVVDQGLTGAGFFSERQVPTVIDSTFYRYNQGRVSIKPF